MRYLTKYELLILYASLMEHTGGSPGVRDDGAIESALALPQTTFGGHELYPTIIEKAAALGFSLIQNHPFIDGNKRIGQAAMECFLIFNGYEIDASVDEQEAIILAIASGKIGRLDFVAWLTSHVVACRGNF